MTAQVQSAFSNLLNAYKRAELEPSTQIGIFSLSSTLTDLAEPSESLKATSVFCTGLEPTAVLLSTLQLDAYRNGEIPITETEIRGRRGAYLVNAEVPLNAGESRSWSFVAEVNQDAADIYALVKRLIQHHGGFSLILEADIAKGDDELRRLVASADGLQTGAELTGASHHFSNVLFNIMRGGVFADGYTIDTADFTEFAAVRNRPVLELDEGVFLNDT